MVSIVAKYAVPSGEWPDLLPFLFRCSQSEQEDHREVSISSTPYCSKLCYFCLRRVWKSVGVANECIAIFSV